MLTRLALILILLAQPLSAVLPALLATPGGAACRGASGAGCAEATCCRVVERMTCCGERTFEKVCATSGGACMCAMAPRAPAQAPAPRTSDQLSVLLFLPCQRVVVVAERPHATMRPAAVAPSARAERSHHARQALLGVWRT